MQRRLVPLLLLLSAPALGQVLPLPPRPLGALTGSEILPLISSLSVDEREALVFAEIVAGNVPGHLRALTPVRTTATVAGRQRTATFWVTPDYLAVGSDGDYFRMPMTPILGQQLADRLGATMPTRKMVDAIWAQASTVLAPSFFSPTSYNILSPSVFYLHHQRIQTQLGGQPPGRLLAGIKKDVVISPLIAVNPGRVVIYGWHQLNGVPVQPLSKVHVNFYADYSHGIRLVQRRMLVGGETTTVAAVLADPQLAPLLSDEGAFTGSRYPATDPPPTLPLRDTFPATGPRLPWRAKFTPPATIAMASRPPDGDGYVVVINDPAGGTDSLRLGTPSDSDYRVSASLYCEYRPELAADGFERVGLFARDNAAGAFDGTLSQQGACYALTWDSDTGRVRCLKVAGGVLTELGSRLWTRPGTAWHRFSIHARGDVLTFLLDGATLLETRDATYPSGEFGIGYHEYFRTNALMKGTRAENFAARSTRRDG